MYIQLHTWENLLLAYGKASKGKRGHANVAAFEHRLEDNLNPFDHFVKRELRCPAYLRYVDDMLLFAEDKPALWAWKAAIQARLARLRLTIHPSAHPHPVTEGIPFLGFVTFPDRRRLKRRKGVHYERKLRDLADCYGRGEIPLSRVNASVAGWVNHVRFGNTVGLRKAIFGRRTCSVHPARLTGRYFVAPSVHGGVGVVDFHPKLPVPFSLLNRQPLCQRAPTRFWHC